MVKSSEWLGLMIGNSHLHWAYFKEDSLIKTWQTEHHLIVENNDFILSEFPNYIPLYLASVVPEKTKLFLNYSQLKLIQLIDIPLKNFYSTLGIDRALAVLGSGENYGFPSLVIDGGTALTLTGINRQGELIGGAILPGLNLQFQSLSTKTAALPTLDLPKILPNRWATNTEDAIASGIIYTLLTGIISFVEDWLRQFPESNIIFTGGDGERILYYLNQVYPDLSNSFKFDSNLIFWGMRSLFLKE